MDSVSVSVEGALEMDIGFENTVVISPLKDTLTAEEDGALGITEAEAELGEEDSNGVEKGDAQPELADINQTTAVVPTTTAIPIEFTGEIKDIFGPLHGEDDSFYLHDPSLGFEDPQNIKRPLMGYSDLDQNRFFPKIDEQSGILFEVVQQFETSLFKTSQKILKNSEEVMVVPFDRLEINEGGPAIKVRIIDPSKPAASTSTQKQSTPVQEKVPGKLLAAIAANTFTPEKLAELMIPFQLGWKREIVMRSHGGGASKKLGDVYYFTPEGVKYRSSKQIAIYLEQNTHLGMTIENFTFAKARVSLDSDQETVRLANGGRSSSATPVRSTSQSQQRSQPKPVDREASEVPDGESTEGLEGEKRGGRRSIQPPKRYATGESVFYPESKKAKVSTTKTAQQQEKEIQAIVHSTEHFVRIIKKPTSKSPIPLLKPMSRIPRSSPKNSMPILKPVSRIPRSSPNNSMPILKPVSPLPTSSPESSIPILKYLSPISAPSPASYIPILKPLSPISAPSPASSIPILKPLSPISAPSPASSIPILKLMSPISIQKPVSPRLMPNPASPIPVDSLQNDMKNEVEVKNEDNQEPKAAEFQMYQKRRQRQADSGTMEMGMLPPKYPRGMEDSSQEGMSGEEMLMEFKRRGRPPKPGGKKDLLQIQANSLAGSGYRQPTHAYNEEEEGALFGISAFTQSAHYGHIRQGMEMNYGGYGGEEYEMGEEEEDGSTEDSESGSPNKQELLPCSIRCPGRAGQIPTLQCKRCLCLYHTKCLGLPNGLYRNFHCSNCEDEPQSEMSGGNMNMKMSFGGGHGQMKQQMMNSRVMQAPRKADGRAPPPLIQLTNSNFTKIRKLPGPVSNATVPAPRRLLPKMPSLQPPSFAPRNMSIQHRQRMPHPSEMRGLPRPSPVSRGLNSDRPGMSVSSIDMRSRGRGRPPRNIMPMMSQMNQKSLTITPISMRGGRMSAPVVPKLQPVSGSQIVRRTPQMPIPIRQLRGGIRPSLPIRGRPVGSGANQIQQQQRMQVACMRRMPAQATMRRNPQTGGLTMRVQGPFNLPPNMSSMVNNSGQLTLSNSFKRYPESVVTINNKKYIVVPKGMKVQRDSVPKPATSTNQSHEDNEEKEESESIVAPERISLPSAEAEDEDINGEEESEEWDWGNEAFCADESREILNLVMQKLHVLDKLSCFQVNKLWNSVANDNEHWETLPLDSLRINDWVNFNEFLITHGVSCIDARGTIMSAEDESDFWDHMTVIVGECANNLRPISQLIVGKELTKGDEQEQGLFNFKKYTGNNCEVIVPTSD